MNDLTFHTKPAAIIPMLYMKDLCAAIVFYKKAFGAKERWRIAHEENVHEIRDDLLKYPEWRMKRM